MFEYLTESKTLTWSDRKVQPSGMEKYQQGNQHLWLNAFPKLLPFLNYNKNETRY